MAGRWNDDLERYWQERDRQRSHDRYDASGMDDEHERWSGSENRTFDRGGDRGGGRVFGERDSGAGYNAPRGEGRYTSRPDDERHGRGGWQDRDYGGVSPAMQRGDYETGYRAHPGHRGRDDDRDRHYGHSYGGGRFGSYEADQRWEREMRRPAARGTYSGGTGGYDYGRGYGEAGREESRGEGFEDRAREAGDFFRRTGRRISNWFSDVAGEGDYDRSRDESYRGARGLGPKGYKRSDERISDDVHQRLADDAWLDATHINVAVSNGEVTLSGTVDSREAKHRAERIVEDLSGVNHVQNNVRVQHAGGFSTGRGYGDSVQEDRMASPDAVRDVTDGNTTPPAQKRN